jgi:hypothetical protein
MKFRNLTAASVVLFGLFSVHAQAQALWNGARYGMTVDQVQRVVPDARQPDRPDGVVSNGRRTEELLTVPAIQVADRTFTAHFYFLDARLVQVTLSAPRDILDGEAPLLYERLLTALRSKYGVELNTTRSNPGAMSVRDTEWMSGRTNVDLYMMQFAGTPPIVNLIYQMRVASEADKL